MTPLRTSFALVVLLTACGTGERACDLVEDLPNRAEFANREEVQEVAEAARESEVERIRTIGEQLTNNLARGQAFESLAPGLAIDVIQFNLDELRAVCRNLEDNG